MKTTSLLFGSLLLIAASGCNTSSYGPASRDFYPNDSPPYTRNAAPARPVPAKAVAALPAATPVVQTAIQG